MLTLIVLAAIVAGLYGVYYTVIAVKRLENGHYLITDHGDGLGSRLWNMIIVAAATLFYLGVARHAIKQIDGHGFDAMHQPLLVLLASSLIYGLIVKSQFKPLREFFAAKPGDLVTPTWPLPSGEPVTLRYRRTLNQAIDLQGLDAQLVHYRFTVVRSRGKTETRKEKIQSLPLGDGGVKLKDDTLKAHWTPRAPIPAEYRTSLLDVLRDILMSRQGYDEWWLEVTVRTVDGPVLDSRFKLMFAPPRHTITDQAS